LLENAVFDPDKIHVMIEAYECACRELHLTERRNDPLTDLVARKIMEITQAETKPDAMDICRRSLRELGISTH
jgi:hypothetical protein